VSNALLTEDTLVTFPEGAVAAEDTVVRSEVTDRGLALITASTPFHPVDAGWPDQGPDRGTVSWTGVGHPVTDVVIGGWDGSALFLGADIPVRRGTAGWTWLVVHLFDVLVPAPPIGTPVTLRVDPAYRAALSAGHTACHLAALALDAALAGRWRKPVEPDPLGVPAFDALANATSRIVEYGSVDTYRLGKSLRKKGFDADGLADELPRLAAEVAARVSGWIAGGGAVRVDVDGPRLSDRRRWVCELPEGIAELPCGGTHVAVLPALGRAAVRLELTDDDSTLAMTTTVLSAHPEGR